MTKAKLYRPKQLKPFYSSFVKMKIVSIWNAQMAAMPLPATSRVGRRPSNLENLLLNAR
jgi:hypothetical protein